MNPYQVPTLGALIADLSGQLLAHVAVGEFPLRDWLSADAQLHAAFGAVA